MVKNKNRLVEKKLENVKKKRNLMKHIQEYSNDSTIHGLNHVFRENETLLHRLVWCCILSCSIVGCIYMVMNSLELYKEKPISITLQDTDFPLSHFPFPSVSICLTAKVNATYLKSYISTSIRDNRKWNKDIKKFISVLNSFVHPYISLATDIIEALDNSSFLQTIKNINLTELMYYSLPSCDSIFKRCSWNGRNIDCCHEVKIIRSEDGFCYSFNTLMENMQTGCRFPNIPKDEGKQVEAECRLRNTWHTGTMSGLEISFQTRPVQPTVTTSSAINYPAFKVYIHCAHELPEPGMGFLVSLAGRSKVGVAVKPRIIQTPLNGIENESSEVRKCLIPSEEENLTLTTLYSQTSCIIQCRLDMIFKACNCSPYHFSIAGKLNEKLLAAGGKESTFCGRKCLPKCNEVSYYCATDREDIFDSEEEGILEVYFRNEGALHYIRELTFSTEDLIVNIGGIVGLFLGSSVISFIELIFWMFKSITSPFIKTKIQAEPLKNTPKPTYPIGTNKVFVVNAWYN